MKNIRITYLFGSNELPVADLTKLITHEHHVKTVRLRICLRTAQPPVGC